MDLRGAQIKTQKKEMKKKPKHKGNKPTPAQVAISTAQAASIAPSMQFAFRHRLQPSLCGCQHPILCSVPRPQDATEHAHGIYGMHSKLGGSSPVPKKFLQKNAAELAKVTKNAEKPAESKSESKRKMGNKAAATTEQAMAKHVFPAKVAKQATPAGLSLVARI